MRKAFFIKGMPSAEQNEICQEVRQHLEALVEDYQGIGNTPEEALTLAVKQFGQPVGVGSEIGRKWAAKREEQAETAMPKLAWQRAQLSSHAAGILVLGAILCVIAYPSWTILMVLATIEGISYGVVSGYLEEVKEQMDGWRETAWLEVQAELKGKKSNLRNQFSQRKSLWGKLDSFIGQRVNNYFSSNANNPFRRTTRLGWTMTSVLWSLCYLAVLILGSSLSQGRVAVWNYLIFFYIFAKVQRISKVVTNRFLLRGSIAQI